VSSLIFDAGGSVCVCMCVYTHTHTNIAHGVLRCERRGRDETSGEPEEDKWPSSAKTTATSHRYDFVCMATKNGRIRS